MKKKVRSIAALPARTAIALGLLLLIANAAQAEHSWGPYHWASSTRPVRLTLGENLTGAWAVGSYPGVYLSVARIDWDTGMSSVLALDVAPGSPKNLRRCAPNQGSIEICNDAYGYTGWLGVASISIEGEHIVSASVRVNDSYFSSSSYNKPEWRQFVMCQEVGHVFGLGHQDENFDNPNLGSCMDYTSDPYTNQHPNAHDYAELNDIYAHSDGSSGGSGDSGGGGSDCKGGPRKCGSRGLSVSELRGEIDLETPSQWGRLISEHGPQEVYELDFGQGRKIVTHVLWTVENAEQGHGH